MRVGGRDEQSLIDVRLEVSTTGVE